MCWISHNLKVSRFYLLPRQEIIGRKSIASGRGIHGGPNPTGMGRRKQEGEVVAGRICYGPPSIIDRRDGERSILCDKYKFHVENLFVPQIKLYRYTNKKLVILY